MSFDPVAYLQDGLVRADWTVTDLWLGTYALGGDLSHDDVAALAEGSSPMTAGTYDLMAAAINERFADRGLDQSMRYWTELPGPQD